MNVDLRSLFTPLIALAILAVVGLQTADALQHSGAWHRSRRSSGPPPDPYARLEAQLAAPVSAVSIPALRDPFAYGPVSVVARPQVAPKPFVPPAPPKPVLTAILQGDNDPRALIRYEDRDYSVRPGSLFADFKVISISADQVVLDRGGQRLTLMRPTKGE